MEHLPECLLLRNSDPRRWLCICHLLRACEERVIALLDMPKEEWMLELEAVGYARGLDAARDAVAGLLDEWQTFPDTIAKVSAVIDALRVKP